MSFAARTMNDLSAGLVKPLPANGSALVTGSAAPAATVVYVSSPYHANGAVLDFQYDQSGPSPIRQTWWFSPPLQSLWVRFSYTGPQPDWNQAGQNPYAGPWTAGVGNWTLLDSVTTFMSCGRNNGGGPLGDTVITVEIATDSLGSNIITSGAYTLKKV